MNIPILEMECAKGHREEYGLPPWEFNLKCKCGAQLKSAKLVRCEELSQFLQKVAADNKAAEANEAILPRV